MRWITLIILAYVVLLLQTTVARLLTLSTAWLGNIGPDLVAILAVFIALHARSGVEVMLAAWGLGLALDLTSAGGVGVATAVGPMSITYALAAGAVYRFREAFFRERILPQVLLALTFCLLAHGGWVTLQCVLAYPAVTLAGYERLLLQALLLAAYTAVLAPLGHRALGRCRTWIVNAPVRGPGRR